MKVIQADVLGMCFGVRDALAMIDDVGRPERVTIHGELVHNEQVLAGLHARGFQMVKESQRRPLPVTDTVLVTAHGISDAERRRLRAAGKNILDTTCPLVERADQAAQKLERDGYHVLVIGKPGHVEVQGIVEDLRGYDVIASAADVRVYPHPRLGIMCQTTTPVALADEVRTAVAAKNPQAAIRFIDTICLPTKEHQRALERLLEQVEAVVIVGGRNSNNTRQLVVRCREKGLPAYHVQGPDDIQAEWFDGTETVGLTAGTSTLDETIQAVHQTLVRLPAVVAV